MNNARNYFFLCAFLLFSYTHANAASNVAGVSGSISKTMSSGSEANPTYAVVSSGLSGESVYSGQIASVTTDTISFEPSSDSSEATVNPFISGVFDELARSPILTSSLIGNGTTLPAGVDSIAITFSGSGFSAAPEIIIDYPTEGDDQATATASINGSGEITSVTVTNAGSGYTVAPSVSVVGGSHLVKLTESGDDNEGRVFLIKDNNETRLTLDISKLESGESLSDVLQADYSIEIVPAPTLGSVFGTTASELDLSPSDSHGSGAGADYVFLFINGSYYSFCFMPAGGGKAAGWYSPTYAGFGMVNDAILFPDEAFIIAKRTSGSLTLDFDGGVSLSDQEMKLPVTGGASVMNNPYGTNMLLGELIPSKAFGTSSLEFYPGTGDADTDADRLYFLVGAEWKQFYYRSGVNDGITKTATATARAGTAAGNGLANVDVSLASGTISNLQSCTASGGLSVDHNDSNHTLVTISGTAPLVGFTITFKDVFGNKINDNGDKELDVNGTEVSAGSGIKVFSELIGDHKITARPSSSTIVVRKRRDVNFINTGGTTRTWSTGQGGTGYNGNAKAYFIGGGNTTMAVATATVSGTGSNRVVTGFDFDNDNDPSTKFDNENNRGAGYQYAPQVIISGGGWRKVGVANPNNVIQDGEVLDATEGVVIVRENPSGILTYFKPKNPFN
jgi:hypothetical protein